MLAGFPCFPQARYTPLKAVGLRGAPGAKPHLQSCYRRGGVGATIHRRGCRRRGSEGGGQAGTPTHRPG